MMLARGSILRYTRWPKPIKRYLRCFTPSMYSATLDTSPISSSIFNTASFAPPCEAPHRQAIPAAIQANGFAPEEPAKTYGRSRSVLLVVGMQNKDAVERASQYWIRFVFFTWCRKHHVQEVFSIGKVIFWIIERQTVGITVTHCRNCRNFGD